MIQQSHFWVFTQKIWNVCQTDIHTPISTAALFTAAKLWKEPGCPSAAELMREMWYGHTRKYHFALMRKEILPFVTTWMQWEPYPK